MLSRVTVTPAHRGLEGLHGIGLPQDLRLPPAGVLLLCFGIQRFQQHPAVQISESNRPAEIGRRAQSFLLANTAMHDLRCRTPAIDQVRLVMIDDIQKRDCCRAST